MRFVLVVFDHFGQQSLREVQSHMQSPWKAEPRKQSVTRGRCLMAKCDLVSPWLNPFLLADFASYRFTISAAPLAVKSFRSSASPNALQQINPTQVTVTERDRAWRKDHMQRGSSREVEIFWFLLWISLACPPQRPWGSFLSCNSAQVTV